MNDLNEQLASWLMDVSDKRGWPDDREKTVMKAFSEENLAPLPQAAYEPYEERRVRVDKKAFITFDTNRYPVDPEWVGFYLSLRACHGSIKLYHESKLLHTHERHWGRAVTIQSKDHQQKIAKSRGIKAHRGDRHALVGTLPSAQQLFEFWRDLGYSLSASAREVIGYINLYGVERVEAAAKIAIAKGAPSSCSIGYLLSQENDQPQPKIQFQLPRDIANIEVHHPPMSDYDELYNK